jgi:DNA-3-methyladenine glycosylase II
MEYSIRPEVIGHLSKDKKLKPLIDNCQIKVHKEAIPVFDDLIRSIVSQQLSTAAAATIYGRFAQSLHDRSPVSVQILEKSVEELMSFGLSYQKASYVQNVARYFDQHNLHTTDWNQLSDEAIIAELTNIKGVGKWTVEMILMFTLHREDVLPLDDLIIRNHMIALYEVTSTKKQLIQDLTAIGEAWRPFRTYACRYLWAAKDTNFFKSL